MSALITKTRARYSAALADSSVVSDEALDVLIEAASDAIETYLGRKLAYGVYEDILDGDGSGELMLRNFPVQSLATVMITDSQGITADVVDDLLLDSKTGRVQFQSYYNSTSTFSRFYRGLGNVKVTYWGGFETIPAAIQQATVMVATNMQNAFASDGSLKSESLGEYSYTRGDMQYSFISPEVKQLIAPYRANVVGGVV